MADSDTARFTSGEITSRDPSEHFAHEQKAAYQDMPAVNVLVAGPAGVGKSTLINAVLRKPLATTGKGRPVTSEIQAWSVDGVPMTVYDTPGLELNTAANAADRIVGFVGDQLRKGAAEHPHVFWYCVHAHSGRFQDAEAEFVRAVAALMPSIVVLTQCFGGRDEDAREFSGVLRGLFTDHRIDVTASSPVSVLALPRKVGPHEYQPFGLRELIDETYELLPEAVQRAFANAQGIDLELKTREAQKIVRKYAAMAAGLGAVPTAPALPYLQFSMLGRITAVMGVELDAGGRAALVRALFPRDRGRMMAGPAFAWMIPLAGGAIGATLGVTATAAMGKAYIATCAEHLQNERDGTPIPADLLAALASARGSR